MNLFSKLSRRATPKHDLDLRLPVPQSTNAKLLLDGVVKTLPAAQSFLKPPEQEDIFLSYDRRDLQLASKIHTLLTDRGWSVFWDQMLRGGDNWQQLLDAKLSDVKCVLVLWSKNSVGSEYVKYEATLASVAKPLRLAVLIRLSCRLRSSAFRRMI